MARKPMDPVKLNLRFTEALRARLEKAAAQNNRSMNEEIVRRLEDSFKPDDFLDALDRLSERGTVRIGNKVRKGGRWVHDDEERS
ncbi:Arc-like DNA binding domain-containing protein [Bradyrhizobium sp. Rc2d]|uniref:Arc family DNA-binding protein n=1 Tax=Bradyrhizobium sp. Rc2d TaxID=1855321 RepID=UPI00088ED3AA|nr:Arc family DNA-binding protein [Bradyrhizobium sp. Rc2d]SDJ33905.1 Arc-like DNA binding domain-containing protein [Bradyrhizobium sp. Rc2d]